MTTAGSDPLQEMYESFVAELAAHLDTEGTLRELLARRPVGDTAQDAGWATWAVWETGGVQVAHWVPRYCGEVRVQAACPARFVPVGTSEQRPADIEVCPRCSRVSQGEPPAGRKPRQR